MSSKNKIDIIGTWIDQQETLSCIEYTISETKNGYSVAAIDSYDSEKGDVLKINWNAETLTLDFCCYWPSTGRFSICKFKQFSDDKLEFTYTHTDREILVRKPTS
ncbi:hypothetical protein [Undibacterium baiyunense]|uniref:Uncharacterized protein n=1 Tax=Undibacterium baiyunense TaxID=2828731 RepID=A0A941I1S4_9BURK|nr:hypothetical protein [Undibacterium baiyunense]MBR7746693.1 hypothetical protein [Undibacterium baiyunense]